MSGLTDLVAHVSDPYERKARLWPALLTLLPLLVAISAMYGPRASVFSSAVALGIACGGLYLLAQISRDRGKKIEQRLFDEWGGKPTTQLLRHRDPTIEATTKSRYHTFLGQKLGQSLPTAAQEFADPKAADDAYQSAVRWLLSQTRDREHFRLLFGENIGYGFRRNALGLKPLALVVAGVSILLVLGRYGVLAPDGWTAESFAKLPDETWISLAISLVVGGTWVFFVTKRAVKATAFAYAEALLRACDVLE